MIDVWFEKNVVLISDLHLWVYKSNRYLDRIIKKINNIHEEQWLDAILVAWDLINRPRDQSVEWLTELFYPFRYADIPVIAVLWNHDVQHPWPDIRKELIQALNTNGVIFLQNNAYALWDVTIVWLWSTLAWEDNVWLLEQCKAEDNIVVLAHNPDVTLKYTTSNQDLTLVGHTHCGQVRLPWVHDKLRPYYYPVSGDFDCGYNKEKNLYISAWLWEVMLPIRFRNPPTIDILRLR